VAARDFMFCIICGPRDLNCHLPYDPITSMACPEWASAIGFFGQAYWRGALKKNSIIDWCPRPTSRHRRKQPQSAPSGELIRCSQDLSF
jgi:hypothetical protein